MPACASKRDVLELAPLRYHANKSLSQKAPLLKVAILHLVGLFYEIK